MPTTAAIDRPMLRAPLLLLLVSVGAVPVGVVPPEALVEEVEDTGE